MASPAPSLESRTRWEDSHGRVARSLRLSVTDRCNLRCVYCMPKIPRWLPRDSILSYEELARLAAVAARCGVRKVRLTGGEPLLRKDLDALVRLLRAIDGIAEITLTTNGLLLAEQARRLADAGLDRVTVSLDTLRPERYERLGGRPGLEAALRGMDAAQAAGFRPLKVNAVVIRGYNEDEIVDLARFGRETGRRLRFIEFMPLEGEPFWSRERVVTEEEIVSRVRGAFPIEEKPVPREETARSYAYLDGKGEMGVIASVTRPFCSGCDRVRLGADGQWRACLFASGGVDLRSALRSGAPDGELARLMGLAVAAKGPGHLIGLPGFERPDRPMHALGG